MLRPTRLSKLIVFSSLPALAVALVGLSAFYLLSNRLSGEELNRAAWESTYVERGLPIPPQGPREGYWGARLGPKPRDRELGWHEPEKSVTGLLEIDAEGLQRYVPQSPSSHRVLIVGGSVAFGSYASECSKTYFHVLGVELEQRGKPTEILVVAAGAWKAMQEVVALERHLPRWKPHVVVFLDGLNDLINGSTSRVWYGLPTPTHDGSRWTSSYHAGDYAQRVEDYLGIIERAAQLCDAHQAALLVALQPSLAERSRPTALEQTLLAQADPAALAAHRSGYEVWRQRLPLVLRPPHRFLDTSRAFDSEQATTFTDQWHFSDPGHAVLGKALAQAVIPLLENQNSGEP